MIYVSDKYEYAICKTQFKRDLFMNCSLNTSIRYKKIFLYVLYL